MATKTFDAELHLRKIESSSFAAAASTLRLLFAFEQEIAYDETRSDAERRARLELYNRGHDLTLGSPIESQADAIAALRYAFEWHEQANDRYAALHERAIGYLERHVAA